ncbi:hypothetical protein AAFF_G00088760 [Aldrovandia affinis]|uniref:Thrombomodulin n=1 Tax=Aldrovandia affinis TaxID=143900 RepID=A0AAD7RWA6_9TELE|nr:hypothetical protein AAFF_G00088760 [Aldrovandia affinis]
MTVSTVSNEAIRELIKDIKVQFWIGLQFNNGGCTDVSSALRGYEWTAGDNLTDFINWRSDETVCAPRCVSVSSDLQWTERPCDDVTDGFLCENSYDSVCDALTPPDTDATVHYKIPQGLEGEGVLSLPPGSIVTGSPSGLRYICAPETGWLQAPWPCEVDNGGCEHQCVERTRIEHLCACPPGHALRSSNNVTCAVATNDPCLALDCDHTCMVASDGVACSCRDGYELAEDGRECRDIDDCLDKRMCPDMLCANTIGGFECNCPAGFHKDKGGGGGTCVDVDECLVWPCEHACSNTEGSYTCSCFDKYIQRSDDHTKCKLHCDKAECPAECDINTQDDCKCPDGFIRDERKTGIFCVDINECDTNYCEIGCKNTFGGYECYCPLGFELFDNFFCRIYDTDYDPTDAPVVVVTPTSNYTDVTSAVTPGGLLGIIVCIVFMILLLVFLVHRISKRRSTWKTSSEHKYESEDMQDLQQVTTQKYTTKSSFAHRDLKQDT